MTTKTFSIRKDLVGKVENVIARLNRRAVKLSVEPVTFVKTAPVLTEIKTDDTESIWVEMVSVTLSLNIPKLADWGFVCTIQHMEGGNLLLTVPGTEGLDLAHYRTCGPVCSHCNLERNRADTYLVRHELTGTLKQVGKNCLADFTGFGKTPEQAAALAEWLSAVATFCDDPCGSDDEGSEDGCGNSPSGVSLDRFLSHVVAVSEKTGFRTRKQSEALGTNSTKDDAIFNMEPPRGYSKETIKPSDEQVAFAKAARAWAQALEPKSDFDHNLKVIASADGVLYRNLGIAAYLVEAYRKHLGQVAERAARPVSVHFGTEGQRLRKLVLTYKGNYSFDSAYGVTFIHRFVTEEGFDAVWKTGTMALCHEGEKITVDATVKKHGDYKGRLQTELSRVKLL